VKEILDPLEQRGLWEEGLALLHDKDPARAAALNKNDWYRLQRALEIAQISAVPFDKVPDHA
jgi:tRNA A37 N6-isopentenylltransferase MiaA